jgi:hypothetical protein
MHIVAGAPAAMSATGVAPISLIRSSRLSPNLRIGDADRASAAIF